MQELWIFGVSWDQALNQELEKRWNLFVERLPDLTKIRIPRWLGSTAEDKVELYGFSDASERVYAAYVYAVVTTCDKRVSSLMLAKTKVSPIKTLSIPRLELCGAHLLARLISEIKATLAEKITAAHCWTDSQVVLSWLSDHPSKWATFVATRVSDILTRLPDTRRDFVSTKENPADLATRGLTPEALSTSSLWWTGSEWLCQQDMPMSKWTRLNSAEAPERRKKATFSFITQTPEHGLIERFSSYNRLVRVVAYCLRFANIARKRTKRDSSPWITSAELNQGRTALIKLVQREHFSLEVEALQTAHDISRKSTLRSLRPFLDADGLLRVGGRLSNAALMFSEKHPVILPKSSTLIRLVILHGHSQTLHGGPQLTMSYLARYFWIIHGKSSIRSVLHGCIRCARFAAKPKPQLIGTLPEARITPMRPFLKSGVDYAGPINVRASKGRGHRSYKGYICIFVCMATKAVHIEAVSDLSTAAFLGAFKRFASRRGRCTELWSDNGTNFHEADAELRKLLCQAAIESESAVQLENEGTSWKFIPPGAPHFGGLWEAAVKSCKYHLRRIIGDFTLTYEELSTVTAQVEAYLNSRPLFAQSMDARDLTALSPAHYLIGSTLIAPPEPYDCSQENATPLSRWLLLSHMRNQFWRRWSTEYLHTLQQRVCGESSRRGPCVAD